MRGIVTILILAFAINTSLANEVVTKNYKVVPFNKIAVIGGFQINLKQSPKEQISISGEKEILNRIKVSIREGLLIVELIKDKDRRLRLKKNQVPSINISFSSISSLQIDGFANIKSDSYININNISLNLNGSSKVDLNINCKHLIVESSGASYIKLNGKGQNLTVIMNGAGLYDGFNFATSTAKVEINGTGKVRVIPKSTLSGSISGFGALYYKGNPKIDIKRNFGIVEQIK